MDGPGRRWLSSILLAAPLVVLAAWVIRGGIDATHDPAVEEARAAAAGGPAGDQPWRLSGLPEPSADLPAARLEERVDGAADYLRERGCRRLIAWSLQTPPADVELLVFDHPDGASAVLERDAGPSRDPGPGDEAAVDDQSVLFRRGVYYARLLADPGAGPDAREGLLETARRLDGALRRGPSGAGQ